MATVIDLGKARLTVKRSRFRSQYLTYEAKLSQCHHWHVTLDDEGHIVNCDDCGKQVEAYWWLEERLPEIHRRFDDATKAAESLQETATKTLHLRASRRVEEAWRSKTMVPTCPHCHEAIYPEDGFGGSCINKRFAPRNGRKGEG